MSFAERLRARRLSCHMSMEALAILVGTSRQTIQRYESGRIARPPYERIEALAAALGIAPGDLMGWGADAAPDLDIQDISVAEQDMRAYITITDDAMDADRILERDTVFYRAEEQPADGALAVVRWDGVSMVRRIWHTPVGMVLTASNSNYPPIIVTEADAARFTLLGTATLLKTLL